MRKSKSTAKNGVILTDSKETLIAYYIGRIRQLEGQLDQLNLLDHPDHIKEVCIELIVTRESLKEKSLDAWRATLAPDHIETTSGILKY